MIGYVYPFETSFIEIPRKSNVVYRSGIFELGKRVLIS